MDTELMQYAQTFEQEVLAYKNLSQDEFIKVFINEENYWDSRSGELLIDQYFGCIEIQHYEGVNSFYFEICLTCGWPNVFLNISTRRESVEYTISCWGDSHSIDLSYLYEESIELYDLCNFL